MKKILILQTRPGIGDLCIFLSAMHEIAKKNPENEITLITATRTKADEILENDPYIKKIIFLDKDIYNYKEGFFSKFFKLKKFISQENFSKAFIMHYGIRYRSICKIAGVGEIFSYQIFKKKDNISKKIYDQTREWLKINSYNRNANLKISNSNTNNKKNIIIGIGSSGLSRRWELKKFINVIKFLNSKNQFNFIIAAGKNEENDSNEIISNVGENINISSMCNDSIGEALKKIKNSFIYFGTDSAFMHLSAGLKVKSFALFGDTPTNYAEYSDLIKPILPDGFNEIGHDSNAMHLIDESKVCNILEKYLSESV